MSLRIEVDYDKCQSNAICMRIAPTIFEVREDGYMYVLDEAPDASMKNLLDQAASECPTQAITIVE